MARCWWGAEVVPYQASFVTLTSSSAPPAAKRRTSDGKIAS